MKNLTTIKKRIIYFVENQGIKISHFYQESGISYGILSQKSKITEDNIVRFLTKYPQVSADWLLTGEGEMLRKVEDQSKNNIANEPRIPLAKPSSCSSGIPLIPIGAVAGFSAGDVPGIATIECELYNIPEFLSKGVEFLIRVSGSSMYPKYSNGDLLACRKVSEILFLQWGKIYVIDSSQGVLVKRVFEDASNPENVICVSDNKENYPPFSMPKSDIRSLSLVVGVVRLE